MIFVLNGVETNNKGAELMLYAILQEIERKWPGSTVYLGVGSVKQGLNYIQSSLKLKYKPLQKYYGFIRRFKLDTILRKLGLPQFLDDIYAIKGADYFLDGSGLKFSDQQPFLEFQLYKYEHLLRNTKKAGTKIVFLPQAFGPIEKEYTKKALASINRYADLIMPRERISMDYLQKSGIVDMDRVRMFTDFTSLVHGIFPEKYNHLKNAVCIIPNERMVSKGVLSLERYIDFLTSISKMSAAQGKKVYFLNHEGATDEKLACVCSDAVGGNIEVVSRLNALETKGVISSAYLVITSRFHGAASALNSGVPCLATSWNHKYAELFGDYQMPDCILDVNNKDESIAKVKELLRPSENGDVREKLVAQKERIVNETQRMWNTIWSI